MKNRSDLSGGRFYLTPGYGKVSLGQLEGQTRKLTCGVVSVFKNKEIPKNNVKGKDFSPHHGKYFW